MVTALCNQKGKLFDKMAPMLFILLSLFVLFFGEVRAQTMSSLLDTRVSEIEKAINAENWNDLKKILLELKAAKPEIKDCDQETPLRMLYGHAAMATGENSIAVAQFYCASDSTGSQSLRDWQSWTQGLIKKYSKSASAHFLYGDALARNGDLKQAKTELDMALKLNPQYILALNARGVVKWLLYESDLSNDEYELGAIDDLFKVTQVSPAFADAWANRGVIGLRDQSDLERAKKMFEEALSDDPTYWLALNGKAVASGATGKYSEFKRDIDSIEKNAINTPFVDLNTGRITVEDKDLKERGFEADFDVNITIPVIKPLALVDFSAKFHWDEIRGGVFTYLKEGENLIVTESGKPRPAATWFALNYPAKPVLSSAVK